MASARVSSLPLSVTSSTVCVALVMISPPGALRKKPTFAQGRFLVGSYGIKAMKKYLSRWFAPALAFCASLVGVSAFAENGSGSTNAIDVELATDAIEEMQTAVSTYWTAAQPVVLSVLGIALVATLIWLGFKLIRKGSNKIG